MKIKVIFRKFPTGEVIALFPELPGTNSARTCLNYMSIGQHGTGKATYEGTKPIAINDIEGQNNVNFLCRELRSIGYTLTIVSRFTHKMYKERVRKLRGMTK